MTRGLLVVFAIIWAGICSAAQSLPDECEYRVKVAFINFDGEKVHLKVNAKTVLESVLPTKDWSNALSHVETLSLCKENLIEWTIGDQAFSEKLTIDTSVGVVYIGNREADLPPKKVAITRETFPIRIDPGRSQDERQTVFGRTDHRHPQGA